MDLLKNILKLLEDREALSIRLMDDEVAIVYEVRKTHGNHTFEGKSYQIYNTTELERLKIEDGVLERTLKVLREKAWKTIRDKINGTEGEIEIQVIGIWETKQVWINNKELTPDRSQAYVNHSPDGFAWGYGGSGPAQLALAICLEVIWDNNRETVEKVINLNYQQFKMDFIRVLSQDDFNMTLRFNPEKYIRNEK